MERHPRCCGFYVKRQLPQIIHTKLKAATDFHSEGGEVQSDVWELNREPSNWIDLVVKSGVASLKRQCNGAWMNATDSSGFENVCCFLDALGNYDKFSGQATYLLVCNRQIGRDEGASDILYIGQSGRLGGRLSDYRRGKKKSTPQDYRILETVGNLTSN